MSLRVWLPLNGTLDNQGLDSVTTTLSGGIAIDNSGKIGKCYNFDGTNGQLLLTNLDLRGLPQVSFAFWCCPVEDLGGLFQISVGGTHRFQIGSPNLSFRDSNNSTIRSVSYNTTFIPGEWTHVVCIYNRGQITIYIDGVQTNCKKTYYHDDSVLYSDLNQYRIGRIRVSSGDLHYEGKLNDFRIYDHALSVMEVKQLSQGLILHYPLNRNGWGQDNLCTGTIGEKAFTKNANGGYCDPINVYPLGADARSLLQNSEVGDIFTCSFDYEVENNQIEEYQMKFILKTASSSFSTEGLEYVFQKGNALSLGDSSGHGEIAFKLKQSHKTYGTGWLLKVAPNKNTNTNIEVTIKNFKFEKGNKATPWRPHPSEITSDSFFNLDNNIEYDCSGYKNNGIKEGTFTYTSNTPKYNVSSIFNGTENIKRDTLEGEIYTLTCWARTTKNKETSQIMVADSKSQMSISFYKGQIIGVFGTTRGTGSKSTLGNSYKENEWNHFAVVKTNTSGGRAIYCNGVLLTPASNDYWSSVAGFFVGTRNNSQGLPFYGEICDIRAYATALSAEDILSLYNNEAYIDNNGNIYGAVYEEG